MPGIDVKKVIPLTMQAMVMEEIGQPLVLTNLPVPTPAADQVLVKIFACGVCRTDLHIVDGELPHPTLPLILGHEITGMVAAKGNKVSLHTEGDLVGIPWLAYTCGKCRYCMKNQENLCEKAMFTGYTVNGGYSEYIVADERFCFPLSRKYAKPAGAPLLCAGLIGYRSYTMIGERVQRLGIYGFGAAAHILVQLAVFQKKEVYAFTRPGDEAAKELAKKLGAVWAEESTSPPPVKLDAAIIFAPVGDLIPKALSDTDKGGVVVCAGIHMSDIPSFPYRILWEERVLRSVANLTRNDGIEFLQLAPKVPIRTTISIYPLSQANQALNDLRSGIIHGAAVLSMS